LIPSPLIIFKSGVEVDEVKVFEPLLGVGLQGDQPPYRLGIDRDLVLGRIGHIGQVQPRDEVVAIAMLLVRQITQGAAQVEEAEVGVVIAAQTQPLWDLAGSAQEDDHRCHAAGLRHLG